MSEKKPTPVLAGINVRHCPVCGKRAYSREGIHPQCAMSRAGARVKPKVIAVVDLDATAVAPL